jgi:hypothetical protein
MKYELKGVKTIMGHEGIAFTATIYEDGKKFGYAHDAGDGGMVRVDYLDGDNRTRAPKDEALTKWHRENCTDNWSSMHDSDPESAVNLMFEIWENNKKAKTKILFKTKVVDWTKVTFDEYMKDYASYHEEEYQLNKATIADRDALFSISKQHADAHVWDPSVEHYVPIADLLAVPVGV